MLYLSNILNIRSIEFSFIYIQCRSRLKREQIFWNEGSKYFGTKGGSNSFVVLQFIVFLAVYLLVIERIKLGKEMVLLLPEIAYNVL
jgi:hypothetical protein